MQTKCDCELNELKSDNFKLRTLLDEISKERISHEMNKNDHLQLETRLNELHEKCESLVQKNDSLVSANLQKDILISALKSQLDLHQKDQEELFEAKLHFNKLQDDTQKQLNFLESELQTKDMELKISKENLEIMAHPRRRPACVRRPPQHHTRAVRRHVHSRDDPRQGL